MKHWFQHLTICLALVICGGASADDDVPLKFTRLDLTDGRKLKNVVVKSYDAKSEKLLVIADGKAMTLSIALVPSPFNERLKNAPPSGGSVSTVAAPPRQMATAADQYYMDRLVAIRQAPVVQVLPQPAPPPVDVVLHRIAQHEFLAKARAERYYTFEYPVGSSSSKVTLLSLELETPKPVPGWEGRCEVQGKAFIEFFDSKGRSFQRTTSTFEVVTEQKSDEAMKVIDFRVKS